MLTGLILGGIIVGGLLGALIANSNNQGTNTSSGGGSSSGGRTSSGNRATSVKSTTTITSITLSAQDGSQQFKTGDHINIGATVKKGDEFMHYNVYIKNSKDSSGTDIYKNEKQTSDSFSDVWDSGFNPAGDYSLWVVAYNTSYNEEDKKSQPFTLKTAPNIDIEVQENTGNGKIKVGGKYSDASHISLDYAMIDDSGNAIAGTKKSDEDVDVNTDEKTWSRVVDVEGGKKYRFAVKAYNTKDDEKWDEVTKEAEENNSIIRLVRKWEYNSGTNSSSSTTGTFTIDDDSLTGYILEPYGASTTESGKDKRVPAGTYSMVWHTRDAAHNYIVVPNIYNDNVSKSRAILIHVGNTGEDTTGCLMPGSGITVISKGGKKYVSEVSGSKAKFTALIEYIESKGIENVKLIITESYEDYK